MPSCAHSGASFTLCRGAVISGPVPVASRSMPASSNTRLERPFLGRDLLEADAALLLVGQRVLDDRAIAKVGLVTLNPRNRVHAPFFVIPLREILVRMRATRFLTRLGPGDRGQCIGHQV